MAIFSYIIIVPIVAFAGAVSAFSGKTVTYQSNLTSTNSQNVDILEKTDFSDIALGGGNIEIAENSVLVPTNSILSEGVVIKKPTNGKISVYEVREGDTLSQIAEMFNVSVNTIRWANDFSGAIQPGQKLVILPVTGVTHTIKYGGSISDVAEIYDADVNEIALFNGLDKDVQLEPGDEIIVPYVDPNFEKDHDHKQEFDEVKYASAPSSSVSGGYYKNPIPGGIITQGYHGYNAIDVGAPYGTPIYAAATGKVITNKQGGWNGGYGSYIVISHANGTQTLYSHQSSNNVYVGQVVEAGEVIGYVGSTGRSTGNHLHFEVRGATNPLGACSVGSRCYID